MKRKYIGLITIAILLIGMLVYVVVRRQQSIQLEKISNFKECVAAGYPIAESYPAQCFTPDGRGFIEEIGN